MTKRLKIICDTDGVCLDLVSEWASRIHPSLTKGDITTYNVLKAAVAKLGAPENFKPVMQALVEVPYWACGFEDRATTYLPLLADRHDFRFVSHTPIEYDTLEGYYHDAAMCLEAKQDRLRSVLPGATIAGHTAQSRLDLDGDVLIDDRLDTVLAWSARHPQRRAVLFNQPWNQAAELPANVYRAAEWGEVFVLLESWGNEVAPAPAAVTELYPEDAKARKMIPRYSGFVAYFPDAIQLVAKQDRANNKPPRPDLDSILADYSKSKEACYLVEAWQLLTDLHPEGEAGLKRDVARVSWLGNEQHSPGQPLHWARGKSMDQLDALARHVDEYLSGKVSDKAGYPIIGQAGWRVMAELQLNLEAVAA